MEYVGADIDINNVVCSVMSTHGKLKETFVIPSNPEEMDQLIEKMGNQASGIDSHGIRDIVKPR